MSELSIRMKPDGPYVVSGPLTIVDPAGEEHEIAEGRSVGLCRCGHSKRKPFCDRSHIEAGFQGHDAWPET
jgi:CDGSH-type Zn-finger protein